MTEVALVLGKPLSPSERNVLFYTALGLSADEIGDLRYTTGNTAVNQRKHILTKLGVYSSLEAVCLLLVTDNNFYNDVKEAVLAGLHKPTHRKGYP